jgi:DNA-binding transcriptional MerR regulator
MEYTIQKLSQIAGISSRTLRYYDEIGLLKPARINSSGYRIYGQREVNLLQQILFYKELGVGLIQIKEIITEPNFDPTVALREHHTKLLLRKRQLDLLIHNVENTIAANEGRITMKDHEKFEGFKDQLIENNEKQYGKEIRKKYGEDTVNQSNQKIKGLTEEQYQEFEKLGIDLMEMLNKAFQTGDPTGRLAEETVELHKKWLGFTWNSYSAVAHRGLAQMYVDDARFTAYYDKEQPGLALFLRDAIHHFIK